MQGYKTTPSAEIQNHTVALIQWLDTAARATTHWKVSGSLQCLELEQTLGFHVTVARDHGGFRVF